MGYSETSMKLEGAPVNVLTLCSRRRDNSFLNFGLSSGFEYMGLSCGALKIAAVP